MQIARPSRHDASRAGGRLRTGSVTLGCLLLLAACGGSGNVDTLVNRLPAGVTQLGMTVYPATARSPGTSAATQDLLTGGLGRTGLAAASAPAYADPAAPTAAELRRNAIYSNYRGLVDVSAAGGFGTFYGPNVDTAGAATAGEGLLPGREYLAVLDDGSGRKQVPVAVQVPDSFDTRAPCIVLGPSSGSRGLYGAIGTSAEWALKRGCAVALTDAGKGIGLHDLGEDTVNRIDGTRTSRAAAGTLAHFAADIGDAARAAYNALWPHRLALKQVHSQRNPEKDWGHDTLAAARYALYVLNERYGSSLNPVPFDAGNTLVIAGSVSNGGAAVLRAAELDDAGLIDGVVAGEPVTEMPATRGYAIAVGGTVVPGPARTLADYTTFGNLYQPCAALAAPAAMAEVSLFNYLGFTAQNGRAAARCAGLAAKGLVSGTDTAAQALDALQKLRAHGWSAESDPLHNAHYGLGNGPILSAMYPVMYGRFSVADNVCNTSFAQVDATGSPVRANPATLAQSYAVANGTANGTPAAVVYNDSVGGARVWNLATSASTNAQDFGLDNALCQRALVTGVDETGAPLTASASATRPTLAQSRAVQAGIAEVLVDGRLRARPALIVAGRADTLIPLNHNARAYAAFNRSVEGGASRLGYIEVTNAQHFDGFLSLSGFDNRFVPLHLYFVRAMDAMHAHLTRGTALPPSQVVRATPRGGAPGAAPALTAANVPAIGASPAAGDRIGFVDTTLNVPQ